MDEIIGSLIFSRKYGSKGGSKGYSTTRPKSYYFLLIIFFIFVRLSFSLIKKTQILFLPLLF